MRVSSYIFKVILLAVIAGGVLSCASEWAQFRNESHGSTLLETALEEACLHNDTAWRNEMFVQWRDNVRPASDSEIALMNDTLRALYELYPDVREEQGTDDTARYVVLQSSIRYLVLDSAQYAAFDLRDLSPGGSLDSTVIVEDFRPTARVDRNRIIYNSRKYQVLLRNFFEGRTENPIGARDRTGWRLYSKKAFIEPMIRLSYWDDMEICMDFETWPVLQQVRFRSDLRRAWVSTGGCGFGIIREYTRSDSGWVAAGGAEANWIY